MTDQGSRPQARPSICLMMIVRDEEATLPRLIQSVLPVISSWVIADTGSTDKTREVVGDLLSHLPGKLIQSDWVNFGQNRSELIQQMPQDAEFAFLLDADHVLELESVEGFFEEISNDKASDCFLIQVNEPTLNYAMPYLVRSGPKYRYVGSTHEYLSATTSLTKSEPLISAQIIHFADGGSKVDKIERDRRLLEQDLRNGDESARTRFYLGQTLESLGQSQEAMVHYRECISRSSWDEEKYVANLRIGRLLNKGGEPFSAFESLLAAHEICPDRSEALYEIVKLLQKLGGFKFAHLALNSAGYSSKTRVLFIEPWISEFALPIEEAVIAWRVGHVSEAREKFNRILEKPGLTAELETLVLRNLEYC